MTARIEPTITKAEAAALVRRTRAKLDKEGKPVFDADKQPVVEEVAVPEADVMAFAEYDDRVVVVTSSAEKLEHLKKKPGPINGGKGK